MNADELNDLSGEVIDAALRVHTLVGPGLLESAYQQCLSHELRERGHDVATQILLPLVYRGVRLESAYRIDMLVEHQLIVEVKAIAKLHPIHHSQLLSYLRLSGCRLGLLINFHVPRLKHGIKRIVNGL